MWCRYNSSCQPYVGSLASLFFNWTVPQRITLEAINFLAHNFANVDHFLKFIE